MQVRVRYAPSPTGLQHIGGVRTALFNYFFARANGGKFILRVEDTDRERYSTESLQDLYDTLEWLGIKWDEGPVIGGSCGPYVQSERFELYREYAQKLVDMGKAYYCYCTPQRLEELRKKQEEEKSSEQGYDRHCRNLTPEQRAEYEKQGIKPVIRLKVPTEGSTTFHDILMGDITRENKDISPDPVLLKSDGFPTYHLANVIDDHLMGVTHIMRAQEWIPSGPLHVILYEAFGWEVPQYCHLPMVMGKETDPVTGEVHFAKLSKRHGSTSVRDFRKKGYLPEALLNYVSLVGWSYDGDREFFTREELENVFCLEKINKAPGVFDYQKLDWFNGQYIRKKTDDELADLLMPYLCEAGLLKETDRDRLVAFVPGVRERLVLLSDAVGMCAFLKDQGEPAPELLIPKKMDAAGTLESLKAVYGYIRPALEKGASDDEMQNSLCELAQKLGIKNAGVFNPLRTAVTGLAVSPPPFSCMRLLDRAEVFRRIERAIKVLESCSKER
ncbi:MAG: glutamate--tRNA ligase [Sphaerochaetaceae bacterium]|nr:glutamate--tRNA ligase [Sphaerochaetaceae bacterium]